MVTKSERRRTFTLLASWPRGDAGGWRRCNMYAVLPPRRHRSVLSVAFLVTLSLVGRLYCPSSWYYSRAPLIRSEAYLGRHNHNSKASAACYPSFGSFGSGNRTISKIYFYHTRKAGGTSLRYFLQRFAMEHNLTIKEAEYEAAESPFESTNGKFGEEENTFYVTVLREPVARSVSHFKYSGRWPCDRLVNSSFIPNPSTAKTLEDWIDGSSCKAAGKRLVDCSVNCYSKWFSDRARCDDNANLMRNFEVARRKLKGYHLIVVQDWLSNETYVRGLEAMFGMRGYRQRPAWCENKSRMANEMYPLVVRNETLRRLINMNRVDRKLFDELTSCPDGVVFPKFDRNLFHQTSRHQCLKVGVKGGKCDEPMFLSDYKVIIDGALERR